jgi:hypothetical protein
VECSNAGKPSGGSTIELETVSVLPALDEEIAGLIDDVAQVRRAFREGKEGVKELFPLHVPAALILDSSRAKDRRCEAWVERERSLECRDGSRLIAESGLKYALGIGRL